MPTVPIICRVRALYSFKSNDKSSLPFEQGDCIEVLNKLKSGWWDGWCNGSRGWFPSNYVQIIEEYTNSTVVELPPNVDNVKQQAQSSHFYGESTRPYTPNTSPPLPRAPKNGVPLQRNQEYRLSLPYNHSHIVDQPPSSALPANWIMEMTEDRTDCYYYNKLTGEMRTSPPTPPPSSSALHTFTNDTAYNHNLNDMDDMDDMNDLENSDDMENEHDDDDDDDNDESGFHQHTQRDMDDDDEYDFRSVNSQLDGRFQTTATHSTATSSTISNTREPHDGSLSGKLPSHWVKRSNHQGRVYYCNLRTQETTWDINLIDPITGTLSQYAKTDHTQSIDSQAIQQQRQKQQQQQHHPIHSASSSSDSSPYHCRLDINEPLTWNILSTRIAVAINELNEAGKNGQVSQFTRCAAAVIDSIRLMLLASGTIDKDAGTIRSNALLRGHHRTMMAAMSKVMLTSFLTADHGGGEYINKLLSENNDLLVAVRNFVGTCQDIAIPVQHIDPKLVPTETDANDTSNNNTNNKPFPHSSKTEQAKYALQHDLADNLDVYGTNMHESVDAILFHIKTLRLEKDALLQSDDTRFQFSTKMFTQFRNLSSQTGQFLGLVGDIDFGSVKSNSPLLINLQINKQSLSDGLGHLFCHFQQLTNAHVPISEALSEVEDAAQSIHIPIRNICECINIMVYDNDISTRPPLDTITDTIQQQQQAAAAGNGSHYNDDHVDDVHYDDDRDDDRATYLGGSVFSGGDLTYNGTEITTPSLTSSQVSGGKKSLLDQHALSPSYLTHNSHGKRSSSDSQANAPSSSSLSSASTSAVATRQKPQTTSVIEKKQPRHVTSPSSASASSADGTAVATLMSQDAEVTKSSHKLKKFFGDDVPSSDIVTTKPAAADRPSYLSYDYDAADISFNMEGNVKGGTLPALVERLTLHDYLDMNFNNTFLLTYRSFCTSTELLDLLEARYNLKPPSDISDEDMEIWRQKKLKLVRLRVFNVLKNWLEVYYDEEDSIILDRLTRFTDTTIRTTLSFSTDQLERLIQKRKEGTEMDVGGLKKLVWTPQSIPQSILPRNPKKFKLLDLDPTELARQLTIMDFKMYSSIRPIECLDKSWSRETPEDAPPTSVNIRASIEYCNQITSWVSDAILSQNDIKKRTNLIKFWVQVAEKCRELNNFNTCMAILSAFDNSSVGRLKRTWEMVGARTNQILSHIRRIMGANRNFSEYRQLIHSVNPPCIPFLGIYLQDLTFIEDGNSNIIKKSKDLINFAKREKTAEVIREIQQYQTLFYKLKTVEEVQSFIRANLQSTRDEDQLYKESLKLEPREREDEKITRLLQESGFL